MGPTSFGKRWTATFGNTLRFGKVFVESKDAQHQFQIEVVPGSLHSDQFGVELYAGPSYAGPNDGIGAKAEILAACKISGEHSGAIVYSICCPATRPATDYTARIVPSHAGAAVPLEANQILWQQ